MEGELIYLNIWHIGSALILSVLQRLFLAPIDIADVQEMRWLYSISCMICCIYLTCNSNLFSSLSITVAESAYVRIVDPESVCAHRWRQVYLYKMCSTDSTSPKLS